MTVYLDLLMLVNFMVDLFLMLGTNRLSGLPPGWRRTIPAAVLGSVYAGACMLPGMMFLGRLPGRIVVLLVMGGIAFGWRADSLRRIGLFLLLSLAVGGVALGMGRQSVPMLILSSVVVWLLCVAGFGAQAGGREYVPVSIPVGGKVMELTALRDTGNTLRDPLTGESVIVIGVRQACRLTGLTREQLRLPLETLTAGMLPGARLIPYRTVGQPGGMLLGKRYARVKIGGEIKDVILAFAGEEIGAGEPYQALTGGMV